MTNTTTADNPSGQPLGLPLNDLLGQVSVAPGPAGYSIDAVTVCVEAAYRAGQAEERRRLKADAETWGNALNEASWAHVDAYRRHTGQVESALFFNNGKSILRDALAAYFKALGA
jgi:hypothetical protein